jgi:hypothetical protein
MDVDADGIVEIVRRFECVFMDFFTVIIIVDDDGPLIKEEYIKQKELKRKVKMDIKGNLFMWDKETPMASFTAFMFILYSLW